jgi:hypothetical protein
MIRTAALSPESVLRRRDLVSRQCGVERGRPPQHPSLLGPGRKLVVGGRIGQVAEPDGLLARLDAGEVGRLAGAEAVDEAKPDESLKLLLSPDGLKLAPRNLGVPLLGMATATTLADQDAGRGPLTVRHERLRAVSRTISYESASVLEVHVARRPGSLSGRRVATLRW